MLVMTISHALPALDRASAVVRMAKSEHAYMWSMVRWLCYLHVCGIVAMLHLGAFGAGMCLLHDVPMPVVVWPVSGGLLLLGWTLVCSGAVGWYQCWFVPVYPIVFGVTMTVAYEFVPDALLVKGIPVCGCVALYAAVFWAMMAHMKPVDPDDEGDEDVEVSAI